MASIDKHWEKEPQNHGQEIQGSGSSQESLGQKERTRARTKPGLWNPGAGSLPGSRTGRGAWRPFGDPVSSHFPPTTKVNLGYEVQDHNHTYNESRREKLRFQSKPECSGHGARRLTCSTTLETGGHPRLQDAILSYTASLRPELYKALQYLKTKHLDANTLLILQIL